MRVGEQTLAQALRANLRRRKQAEPVRGRGRHFAIEGGVALEGEIQTSGAKNAALPLMIACLLSDEVLTLSNLPQLSDITRLRRILAALGVAVRAQGGGVALRLDGSTLSTHLAPHVQVSRMRAGFWVLGPLLVRLGEARVPLPGGDAIGARPVDMHLAGLRQMGAKADYEEGMVVASAPNGLKGAAIKLPFPSVGATHHLLLSAVLAQGETHIANAAIEPEVLALAACLQQMGAEIQHQGREFHIRGVKKLHGTEFIIPADRIEAGTYAIAAAISGGEILLRDAPIEEMGALLGLMTKAGIGWRKDKAGLVVARRTSPLQACDCMTRPYPAFPTDLQAQWMALMALAQGKSIITETIFENRFGHAAELQKFGANITLDGRKATIEGVQNFTGASAKASDLRASASLVLAGLAARGLSQIYGIYHLERGFETMAAKLNACGATVRVVG